MMFCVENAMKSDGFLQNVKRVFALLHKNTQCMILTIKAARSMPYRILRICQALDRIQQDGKVVVAGQDLALVLQEVLTGMKKY